jgi:hypothetical protein
MLKWLMPGAGEISHARNAGGRRSHNASHGLLTSRRPTKLFGCLPDNPTE